MLPTPNASLKGPFGTLLIVPAGIEAGELQRFQVFSPHGGAGSAAQMAAGQILQGVAGYGSAVQAIRGLYVNRWGHLTGLAPDALVARLRRDLADGIMFAAFYIPSDDFTRVATTQKPDTAMLLADPPGGPIAWSPAQRIAAMLRRVPANMPEAMRAQVAALYTPQAIALMALMMAVLAVAQLYVAGEIVDSILIAFAWASAGWAGLVALKRFIGAVIDAAGETALPPIEADAKTAADALGLLGIAFITAVVARARDQENIFAKDEAPVKEPPPVKKPAPVAKGWKDYPSTAGKPPATTPKANEPPANLKGTLERISKGEKFPHRNDGSIFKNNEGLLPSKPLGYYNEYVHPTPGMPGPGAQRVIIGQGGEVYYTPDHYKSFIPVK